MTRTSTCQLVEKILFWLTTQLRNYLRSITSHQASISFGKCILWHCFAQPPPLVSERCTKKTNLSRNVPEINCHHDPEAAAFGNRVIAVFTAMLNDAPNDAQTMPSLMEQPSPSILGPRCRSCKTVPKMQTSYITTTTSSYLQIGVVQARHRGGHCGSTWSSSSWRYVGTNRPTQCGAKVQRACKSIWRVRDHIERCPVWWSSPRQAYLAHAAGLARQFLKCRHPTLQKQHHRICRLMRYKLVIVVDIVVQRGLLLPGAMWYRH